MRYIELIERAIDDTKAYPYHFIGTTVQTHEFDDPEYRGARLPHPIEKTKYAFESDNGLQYIVHCNLSNHELDTSFTVKGGSYSINGAGDASRVLSTVSKIVADYCRHEMPRVITFTARRDEPSRVRLYDFMTKPKQVENFFPGFTLETREPYGRNIKYVLTRPLTARDHEIDAEEAAAKATEKARKAAEVSKAPEPTETPVPASQASSGRSFDDFLRAHEGDDELLRMLGIR
jgi:hypothetical protein